MKVHRQPLGLILLIVASVNLCAIAQAPARSEADRSVQSQVKLYLTRLSDFEFSGAVLVKKRDKVLIESGYGFANKKSNIPFNPSTIFDIGSVTKQFTAAAILVLETDGKLRVSDHISKHLKGVPSDKADITIHHLLTHTSGIPLDFGNDYEKVSRDEIVRRAMSSALNSVPGKRHAYSNAGFSLLAAIVEIVSGKSFEAFLRDRRFTPAQMGSTGYSFSITKRSRTARGYKDGEDWGTGIEKASATGGSFWNLIGNGGIHSTIADMHKWMTALKRNTVLTKGAKAKLFAPHVLVTSNYQNSNAPLYYAYGWYVWQRTGKTMIFHLGGNGVFNAAVRHTLDDDSLVIYGSNVSEYHDPAYPVPAIERILEGETVAIPPKLVSLLPDKLVRFDGRYVESASQAQLWITSTPSFLRVEGEGQEALSFIARDNWHRDASLEAFNWRTAQALDDSRAKKYEELAKSYETDMPATQLGEFEALFWQKRRDRHGEYRRTRILGTLPSGGRKFVGRTLAAIDFERGTTYREYFWTSGGKVGDVGPINSPPSARYFAESENCFLKFDPAAAIVRSRICFIGNTGRIEQGDRRIELKKL